MAQAHPQDAAPLPSAGGLPRRAQTQVTMYRVLLERAAEKDLSRLSSEIHDRVIAAIQALANNPRPRGCRKLAGSEEDWRIRVGDYRVVYEIADPIRVVRVNRVRHRREVYR